MCSKPLEALGKVVCHTAVFSVVTQRSLADYGKSRSNTKQRSQKPFVKTCQLYSAMIMLAEWNVENNYTAQLTPLTASCLWMATNYCWIMRGEYK